MIKLCNENDLQWYITVILCDGIANVKDSEFILEING